MYNIMYVYVHVYVHLYVNVYGNVYGNVSIVSTMYCCHSCRLFQSQI